ncbi:TIR domain-containing protein [Geodermatophilus sp. FMUSA9-8]|uniref:TIR domain-containing protein n=1 Tax=Geodermatophilus sp. FMUSA9-8 TaxID=3120155 RepID=UPI00300903DF
MYPSTYSRRQFALARIEAINRRFDLTRESRTASGAVRHKCFVSYHSADTEEAATFVESFEDVFIPRAIGVEEGDGSIINSEDVDYIRDVIRTKYLKDSTVTIVLVGKCSWARKFVDWEIYASLRNTETTTRNGLLGILLPSLTQNPPTAPTRLVDNVPSGGGAAYGRYHYYPKTKSELRTNIEDAFHARGSRAHLIDNSRPLRKRNGTCS